MSNIVEQLKNGIVNVTFTKADGTSRTMAATLNADAHPSAKKLLEGVATPTATASGLIAVVDTEIGQWRNINLTTAVVNS